MGNPALGHSEDQLANKLDSIFMDKRTYHRFVQLLDMEDRFARKLVTMLVNYTLSGKATDKISFDDNIS